MGSDTALFHATRPINSRRTPLLGFPRPRSLRPAACVDITIAKFAPLCKGWLYGPPHYTFALPLHPWLDPVYEGAMKSPRMDMRSSLAHLPARKQRELERILTILHEEFAHAVKASSSPTRRAGRILKIILFGSHARDDWVEDSTAQLETGLRESALLHCSATRTPWLVWTDTSSTCSRPTWSSGSHLRR